MSHNFSNRKPPPINPYAKASTISKSSKNKAVVPVKKKAAIYFSSDAESDEEYETQPTTTKRPAVSTTVTPDKKKSRKGTAQAQDKPSGNSDEDSSNAAGGYSLNMEGSELVVVNNPYHEYVNDNEELEIEDVDGEVSTQIVGKYVSAADPRGSFAHGYYGELTVLNPIAHSFGTPVDDDCKKLVDLTQEIGGQTPFELAKKSTDAMEVYKDGNIKDDVNTGLESLRALGLDTSLVKRVPTDFLSQPIVTCFLSTLRQIGITQISSFADMVKLGRHGQEEIATNSKLNFFFTPLMIQPPNLSLLNKNAQPEMKTDIATGEKVYNTQFWEGNVEKKMMSGQRQFSSLEMGMHIPDFVLHPQQLQKHRDAIPFLSNHGPMINGGVMLLSLKNAYIQVFLRNMTSGHTIKARMMGYQPLFLMRNCLLQQNHNYGINGCQLSSMNMKPKSYITFAGYYKGSLEEKNLHIIGMTNSRNNLLVETTDSQSQNIS